MSDSMDDLNKNSRPRRKHRNSRNGCPNCKKRRVKCSEDLPSCLNCVKHKVKCGYLSYTDDQIQVVKLSKIFNSPNQLFVPNSNFGINMDTNININPIQGYPPNYMGYNNEQVPQNIQFNQNQTHNYNQKLIQQSFIDPTINSNLITQNYANLVPSNFPQIIYPIYTIEGNISNAFLPQDPHPIERHESMLLNGTVNPTAFSIIKKPNINLKLKFENFLKNFKLDYSRGKYVLSQIRCIYIFFLESLLYQASNLNYNSMLFLNTILNLTTNYLISNGLNQKFIKSNHSIQEQQFIKKSLLTKSVKYYAQTIKILREGLISNEDPESYSSTSYILSLMSIYDPEATLSSFNCFKDGLFSILEHYIYLNKNSKMVENYNSSVLIPVHYELMKNILKSFLYLNYDPRFLNEYLTFLTKFGNILNQLSALRQPNANSTLVNIVEINYSNLYNFTADLLTNYLPKLNKIIIDKKTNPSLIKEEEKVIFEMLHRWSKMVPSEVNTMNEKTDPMMRLLCIFYKSLSKSLCSIIPQSKFFFLKDFESPIMLDTYDMGHKEIFFDVSIVNYISPENLHKLAPDAKYRMEKNLKVITGYLLRLINFFTIRTSILYKYCIVDLNQQKVFTKVDNIGEIRNEILTLKETNDDFNIFEKPILKFSTTLIKPDNYPHKMHQEENHIIRNGDRVSDRGSSVGEAKDNESLMTPDSINSITSPESPNASTSESSSSRKESFVNFLNINYQTGLLNADYNPLVKNQRLNLNLSSIQNLQYANGNHHNNDSIYLTNPNFDEVYDDDLFDDEEEEEYDEELEENFLRNVERNFNDIQLSQGGPS